MEITLEQAERLREKANVSYAKAKEALEYSGGNLLDALIYLEERGDIPRQEGTCYSTRSAVPPVQAESERFADSPEEGEEQSRPRVGLLRRVRYLLLDNELEIWRREQPITAIPVLVVLLLVFAAYWAVVPLAIFGLFLGFRFRFSGPDLERESINSVMDSVADTAAGLGSQVMEELRRQHDRRSGGTNDDREQ